MSVQVATESRNLPLPISPCSCFTAEGAQEVVPDTPSSEQSA